MPITSINDPADPRIAPYIAIRERDLTGRGDHFIVEGKVTLEILLKRSQFLIESLFLGESRLEPLASLLQGVPNNVPVYVAPQALMDDIAGFPVHRGILACAQKKASTPFEDTLGSLLTLNGTKTILVALGISNHDNVGALFRNAAAFGADMVVLDDQSCDPLYRKSIRVSAGTVLWTKWHHGASEDTILNTLKAEGFTCWMMTPGEGSTDLPDAIQPEKLAIIVGPEGPGLAQDTIAKGAPVRIPIHHDVDSLNVATAAALALSRRFDHVQSHAAQQSD